MALICILKVVNIQAPSDTWHRCYPWAMRAPLHPTKRLLPAWALSHTEGFCFLLKDQTSRLM